MPRIKDGVFQENAIENAFINRIVAFIKLGAIPKSIEYNYLEFTPIDSTATAIVKLMTHPYKSNRVFHLFDHNHIYLTRCFKYFKLLNTNFKILQDDDFAKLINSTLKDKNKKEILNFLINDLDKNLHLMYKTDIRIKSEATIKYLSKIGFNWPKISDKYMMKFLELLRRVM